MVWLISNDATDNYMLLSRMKSDCEYFLRWGNGSENRLWAGDVHEHIRLMFKIYDVLPTPPKWLTRKAIRKYQRKMVKILLHGSRFNPYGRLK